MSASTTVTLAPTGGSETASVPSAKDQAGPATFFESGPITVKTEGAPGPTGSSTSSVSITGIEPGTNGPDPFHYETLHSTCASSETSTTGSATLTGGFVNQGNGAGVTLPDNPAPGTEYSGPCRTTTSPTPR